MGVFERHGGEGGGFAWFHGDTAKVDGAAEGALDGGFEEVELAHGGTACGYNDGGEAEGRSEGGFKGCGAGERVMGVNGFDGLGSGWEKVRRGVG